MAIDAAKLSSVYKTPVLKTFTKLIMQQQHIMCTYIPCFMSAWMLGCLASADYHGAEVNNRNKTTLNKSSVYNPHVEGNSLPTMAEMVKIFLLLIIRSPVFDLEQCTMGDITARSHMPHPSQSKAWEEKKSLLGLTAPRRRGRGREALPPLAASGSFSNAGIHHTELNSVSPAN